jgi:hypothetical protein
MALAPRSSGTSDNMRKRQMKTKGEIRVRSTHAPTKRSNPYGSMSTRTTTPCGYESAKADLAARRGVEPVAVRALCRTIGTYMVSWAPFVRARG